MLPTPAQLYQSIFKARKPWPPDFSKLTPKHKFSLERRFRRRMKLKFARPRLHQAVKIGQWSTAAFVLVYGIFYMPSTTDTNIFTPVRTWAKEFQQSIWSTSPAKKTETRYQKEV
ncbi:hypothetical protein L211DRAFT_782514 [Terfezia boudieri ATCC MYA-4762]|uniref:Uncharacterized protein n=1 Tax=Terfezia boudieri ATCC MYA-4762 TaxID=1051890 RepID=A0A3N4LSS6_9PEZI|nr:hypothetical protein L211DRAFT_782514 [Terfezia boudieri ATCC MYA-4762]